MNNINSFSETVAQLTQNVNVAISSLVSLNKSMSTEENSVIVTIPGIDPITGDSSISTYSIPSYTYTITKLNTLENTVDVFVKGSGVILLNDGTYREVKTIPVAIAPTKITGVNAPSIFSTRTNWFFESIMFPQLIVSFDLKDKIDDRSDRVVIKRVIFDNFDDVETQWFNDNFIGKTYTYYETIQILARNQKKYWEDEEVIDLPLSTTPYTGTFIITNKQVINGEAWYSLDTINYAITSDFPVANNLQLKIGDKLRYGENSVYEIKNIVTTENRISLTSLIGLSTPTIGNSFYFYTTPFSTKLVNIPVNSDECNCIFIKGVNDDYNVISSDWSDSINFYSSNLIQSGTSNITLQSYYNNYVLDFGRQLEGQAKEKYIPAFYGVLPSAPVITVSQFEVKQINKQLNASLDKPSVLNLQANIISNKALIDNLQQTIASQKSNLIELTDPAARSSLQAQINSNIDNLSNLTIQYQSDVKTLATLAYDYKGVFSDPKYRVRGFFEIPASKVPSNDPTAKPQQVIQFQIAHRYLRMDGTGNPLDTFSYSDPCTGQNVTGTYTDWVIEDSPLKQKTYNEATGLYDWHEENIQDGQVVNINQVDIPIQKGEKVELKIKSISEAGWPLNPLKSEWSNSVIIDFPGNLSGSDQLTDILTGSSAEQTSIELQKTMDAAGVTSHLADTIPNPNSATGIYYKHQAQYVAYNLSIKDSNGQVTTVSTTDLQSLLDSLALNSYITITRPAGTADPALYKTKTLQSWIQALITQDPSAYYSVV
jgi:hypothetical protein